MVFCLFEFLFTETSTFVGHFVSSLWVILCHLCGSFFGSFCVIFVGHFVSSLWVSSLWVILFHLCESFFHLCESLCVIFVSHFVISQGKRENEQKS